MIDPDEFDAFYKDARARLLLQTYALTGDLPASRSAVRDSFIAAWHHWRKVSRLHDPESWVRPQAWAHAQRRHTARLWHRDKRLDPEARATLDALGKLPVSQRKALLLAHLAAVSMGDLAREVGLPRQEAERQLQLATSRFSVHRDVPTTQIRLLFEPLRGQLEQARWPRASILRRAGAARRRTHTLVGAGAGLAVLLASGTLVTDASGVRPTLVGDARQEHPAADAGRQPAPVRPSEPPEEFSGDSLLPASAVAKHVPGRRWKVTGTTDNTEGDGLVVPCQQARFADARGLATLVRTYQTGAGPLGRAVQTAELSRNERAASRAFATSLGWYAGCPEPRVQLLSTRRIQGLADEARLLLLRSWARPVSTYVVGVARSGSVTTTTFTRSPGSGRVAVRPAAGLLAAAVRGLCEQSAAGACPGDLGLSPTRPMPVGPAPGLLVEVDLPPVPGVPRPWVGTQPRKAMDNDAATRCDDTSFSGRGMSHNVTRTFVIPGARLPAQFGLTQTVATLPVPRARAFVAEVRRQMAACPDKDLGTDVTRAAHLASSGRDLTVWNVRTEISDEETVSFLMGIVRDGTAVSQIGFVPDGRATIGPGAFTVLVERAADRLSALPDPE